MLAIEIKRGFKIDIRNLQFGIRKEKRERRRKNDRKCSRIRVKNKRTD